MGSKLEIGRALSSLIGKSNLAGLRRGALRLGRVAMRPDAMRSSARVQGGQILLVGVSVGLRRCRALFFYALDFGNDSEYFSMGGKVGGSADSLHDSHQAKTKAIRKMVRAIIEQTGGDGVKAKKEMKGTSYSMGRVHFKKKRVAEWDWTTGVLILNGSGKEYEVRFKSLMNGE